MSNAFFGVPFVHNSAFLEAAGDVRFGMNQAFNALPTVFAAFLVSVAGFEIFDSW